MEHFADDEQLFLESSDAARKLGLSAGEVRRLSDAGRLPVAGRTARGGRLYDPATVERLAAERQARKAHR